MTIRNKNNIIENWDQIIHRRWVGPNLWANCLQDWDIVNGVLECGVRIDDFPMSIRTVHAITHEIDINSGDCFSLSVQIRGNVSHLISEDCLAGFMVGAGKGWSDYRAGAIVQSFSGLGGGILCVIDYAENRFTFRDHRDENNSNLFPVLSNIEYIKGEKNLSECIGNILLELTVKEATQNTYILTLTGWDVQTGSFLGGAILKNLSQDEIVGSFAIVAHPGNKGFYDPLKFDNFRCWGPMLKYHPEREFGPIVGTLYSLNNSIMKMTVQFMPVALPGKYLDRFPKPLIADLEYRAIATSIWKNTGNVRITQPEYIAHFRVENWDASLDYEYRVVFKDVFEKIHYYSGTIRKDPIECEEVSFVALTGMGVMGRRADSETPGEGTDKVDSQLTGRWSPGNVWFPHREIVSNIKKQNPDIIFFTGDQIYENNPTKPDRRDRFPVLDYLYKWYLWYWAFRDLTKDRPSIFQIDDHDVIAGNVWGHYGELNLTGLNSQGGGYMMDPLFVQMVERTQCMHNPDAYRFTEPMKNSISSYFCSLTYGGISFAILEDRKFKTPPPKDDYIPKDEIFLGEPQLRFLNEWLDDWNNAYLKVVVSQSTYASTHTNWEDFGLKDYDTGGYPKSGRDRALEMFRKARALIICGDQHLASIIRMGIEKAGDASLQFCVPAVGNIYWRWFFPESFLKLWEKSDKKKIPDVSGDYMDEFNNHFRVIAVANPDNPDVIKAGRTNAWIPRTDDFILKRVSQGDGYGMVLVNKADHTITLGCYPFDSNLGSSDKAQFSGWPYSFSFDQLEGRIPIGYLPELRFEGVDKPVVEVIRENDNETIYITRIFDDVYHPPVYEKGKYTIRVLDPENEKEKFIKKVSSVNYTSKKSLKIKF
jgi:alkaline phosphatase D